MSDRYHWVCKHGTREICSCLSESLTGMGGLKESEEERKALLQERNNLLDALTRLVYELPRGERGNAPGHSHQTPGIWDKDNGALAGTPCRLCDAYTRAVKFVGRP